MLEPTLQATRYVRASLEKLGYATTAAVMLLAAASCSGLDVGIIEFMEN